MSWIDKLNFENAIKEICREEYNRKDFCIDPLRFEDLSKRYVAEILVKTAKKKLNDGNKADKLIEIDVPKSNYILRPGSRPNILDWVIYHSIVNYIGKETCSLIPDSSYSFNRFREQFKRNKTKRQIDHWLAFENKALEDSKKYSYMLVTDITSFFENISLDLLKERLLMLTRKPNSEYTAAVSFLVESFLKPWTVQSSGGINNFGLPQGPSASLVLADIFLYPVDRAMRKRKIAYFRYMDDIRVFTKTKAELKRALKDLVRYLRELKLNLNSKKTDIYDTKDIESLKKVFDPGSSNLDMIDKALRSRNSKLISLVIPSLFELFSSSYDPKNYFGERHRKFFIYRAINLIKFRLLKEEDATTFAFRLLDDLKDKPHLSDLICLFLLAACNCYTSLKDVVRSELMKFIKDDSQNIYEWQEMWILDTLRQLENLSRTNLRTLKKVVNNHELCQGQLALILGKDGNLDDRENLFLKIKSGKTQNEQIRYFSLAVQEMHRDIRKQILPFIPEYFKEYFLKLTSTKYGTKYSLSRINLDVESEY